MEKEIFKLSFILNEGEGGGEPNTDPSTDPTPVDPKENDNGQEPEPKEPPKKVGRPPKEKTVSITQEEYKQLQELKRANMSNDELKADYERQISDLSIKMEALENSLTQKTKEIEQIKVQDTINTELNKIISEKPYLKESIDLRLELGFKSLQDLNEFIKVVDTETMKKAYEISQANGTARRLGTNQSPPNVLNTQVKTGQVEYTVDLGSYGIKDLKNTGL